MGGRFFAAAGRRRARPFLVAHPRRAFGRGLKRGGVGQRSAVLTAVVVIAWMANFMLHAAPVYLVSRVTGLPFVFTEPLPWWGAALAGVLGSDSEVAGFVVSWWFFQDVMGFDNGLAIFALSCVAAWVWSFVWGLMLFGILMIGTRIEALFGAAIFPRVRAAGLSRLFLSRHEPPPQ